jgi:beta-phosphoglucomutase family hydrolase
MAEIRAFVFDMDGVIVDSNPLHRMAWEEYNARHGIPTTEAMQRRMYGKRNDEIVRDFFGEHLSGELVFAHGAAKEALYREILKPRIEAALVPGLRAFLSRHRNFPMALGTNAEPANVEFVLREAGLGSCFRAVVDGHQVQHGKPHPEVYLLASGLLGIAPEFCVVFEDSATGVEAALAAGMRVAGVGTTYDELPGVSLMIQDFNDPALETWLSRQT